MAQDIGEVQTLYDKDGNALTVETINGVTVLHVASVNMRRTLQRMIEQLEAIEQQLEESNG